MSYPHFIAIDASSYEDTAYPIAIAWSLSDGTIKTTLIQPDDDWEEWDSALEELHGINQETLYQRGETPWSVIRELENDLEQSYLATDDVDRCEQLLETLYETCQRELSVELGSYTADLFQMENKQECRDQLSDIRMSCDDRVTLMLHAWARENNVNSPSDSNTDSDIDDPAERDDTDSSPY